MLANLSLGFTVLLQGSKQVLACAKRTGTVLSQELVEPGVPETAYTLVVERNHATAARCQARCRTLVFEITAYRHD